VKPGPAQHRVCGGIFTPDPAVPLDQKGRATCRCQLVGVPGDAHHTLPDAPVDVQQLRAGEGDDR
jgi:hypothetical protein